MLTYIHNAAFKGCTRLVSADFSNCIKLQKINSEAFANCMNLADFTISNDEAITNIGDKAFYNTLAIRTMTIPESVREIGADAFGLWVPQQIIYVLGKMSVGDFSSAPSSWPGNATLSTRTSPGMSPRSRMAPLSLTTPCLTPRASIPSIASSSSVLAR